MSSTLGDSIISHPFPLAQPPPIPQPSWSSTVRMPRESSSCHGDSRTLPCSVTNKTWISVMGHHRRAGMRHSGILQGSHASPGLPKAFRALGCSCTRCFLRDHSVSPQPCTHSQSPMEPSSASAGAILGGSPREQGDNHGIPQGVELGGTWKVPEVPSSAPVSTAPTGSEALWAFPLTKNISSPSNSKS